MEEATKAVIKVVVALHPAFTILQSAFEYYDRVKYSKARCRSLLQRAERILRTIGELMKENRCSSSAHDLERLRRNFKCIQQTIKTHSHMSFLKSLLRLDDINTALDEGHRYLDDCLTCFQIRMNVALQKNQQNYQEDIGYIKRLCAELVEDHRMHRALNVKPGQVNDAKLAMQHELQRDQKESPKRELIVQSLSYLERTTGKIDLKKQPRWIITYYDVTIDPKAELGGGGFGVVIRGEWRGLPVAVKRIKSNDLKELTREVETWYNLRHDHIVPCYGASLTAEPPFIVLRYMEKGDLLRYLRQNPDANRVKLINEVSLGMRYLHDEKIVHGDIKVVNVLVDDSGKACLTDFGLSIKAQKNESPKRSRSAAGTLRYMAPEAIRGDLTFATDVYSFGMLIFETFTLRSPFLEESDSDIISGRAKLNRPGQDATDRGFTDAMWELLQDCSSREASRRPNSAEVAARTTVMVNTWDPASHRLSITNVASYSGTYLHARSTSGQVDLLSPGSGYASSDGRSHSQRSIMELPDIPPSRIRCHTTRNEAKMTLNSAGCPIVREDGYKFTQLCYPEGAKLVQKSSKPSFTAEVIYGKSKVRETWELSGTTIRHNGALTTFEWRFGGDDLAQQWFDRILQYAQLKTPEDDQGVRVAHSVERPEVAIEWKTQSTEWRRAIKGRRMESEVVFAEQDVPPPEFKWRRCTAPPRNVTPYPDPSTTTSAIYVIDDQDDTLRYIRTFELNGSSVIKKSAIDEHHSSFQIVEEQFKDAVTAGVWFDLVNGEYEHIINSASGGSPLHGHTPSLSSNRSDRGHSPAPSNGSDILPSGSPSQNRGRSPAPK